MHLTEISVYVSLDLLYKGCEVLCLSLSVLSKTFTAWCGLAT